MSSFNYRGLFVKNKLNVILVIENLLKLFKGLTFFELNEEDSMLSLIFIFSLLIYFMLIYYLIYIAFLFILKII